MLNIDVHRLTKCLILNLMAYVSSLSSNDEIINLSGLTAYNISVIQTANDIKVVNGSTKNLDTLTVPEEISIHHNNLKIKEYIDSVYIDMFAPWNPKLLMGVFTLLKNVKIII